MATQYDRKAEDLGNVVMLEHVNLQIPDQVMATSFYVSGLGLTRDPYLNTGIRNIWINVGKSQFHLPTGDPWLLRGTIGLVTPDRAALLDRLAGVRKELDGSKFGFTERDDHIEATCPWGNRFRLHSPDEGRFGAANLGMPYVEFDTPAGTADGIARFYREILGALTRVEANGEGRVAHIAVGHKQELLFRETEGELPPYDGHHIQVYVQDFSGPHDELAKRELITEESNPYQYRFEDILDVETGETLFEIEHEIRSLTHPLYARPLVNRNPAQSQRNYRMGGDEWEWELPRSNAALPGVAPVVSAKAAALAERRARRMGQRRI